MKQEVLVSVLPGRIRMRGHHLRNARLLAGMREELLGTPGVQIVETNARVGSLLMCFDPFRLPQPEIERRLKTLLPLVRVAISSGQDGKIKGRERNRTQKKPEVAVPAEPKPIESKPVESKPAKSLKPKLSEPAATERLASFGRAVGKHVSFRRRRGKPMAGAGHKVVRPKVKASVQTDELRKLTPAAGAIVPVTAPKPAATVPTGTRAPASGNWKRQINRGAKGGMMLSLGTSLGLAAAGAKRGHALSGGVFVALLAVHLWTHRKRLLS